MCGITGIVYRDKQRTIDEKVVQNMADRIIHRGPDDFKTSIKEHVGFGFRRLSIIDLEHGAQPFRSEDGQVTLICNGEIYNYKELRQDLCSKGYTFRTNSDIEVLIPLYEVYGTDFLTKLNGQFALAIDDRRNDRVLLARDHFGICPLYYTQQDDALIFGSEIKAILEYPKLKRKVHLEGLDQILTYPSNISPATIFSGIFSIQPGHYALYQDGQFTSYEYWDLNYPDLNAAASENKSEEYYLEGIEDLLKKSVSYRLNADVPVGFYLSGGLDSSLIGALMSKVAPTKKFQSFSASFGNSADNKTINEQKYQQIMSKFLNTEHNDIEFSWENAEDKLRDVVYYSETPLKETYNLCSIALSNAAREKNIKVILSGEGADELFGGYAGYKFDALRGGRAAATDDMSELFDEEIRRTIWGDRAFVYEKNEYDFKETKQYLYSPSLKKEYNNFDCLKNAAVDKKKFVGKHRFHQRSYADFRLRLSGHLIADHGDRMTLANSVEGRYPFLDVELIDFVRKIPPAMMLNNLNEKYLLKKLAGNLIPEDIIKREKFGFVAPGSPALLKNNKEWVNDLLSHDRIKSQGFFDPEAIDCLKKLYLSDKFIFNPPYDIDLLIIVLTFNIVLDLFDINTI
jgi:asparagine synthase (glutamine-hydrolysing)